MTPSDRETDPSAPPKQQPDRSPAEWISLGIATCVLSGIIGLVIYDWLTTADQLPILSVKRDGEIRAIQGQFYVPFELTNTGGETAESVQVIAELRIGGEVEEAGEQQIDFLADGETEEGAFIFSRDPRAGELSLRIASYKLP